MNKQYHKEYANWLQGFLIAWVVGHFIGLLFALWLVFGG